MATRQVYFGSFNVTRQVFYTTQRSYGVVNIRPLLPGHVLVCPFRKVERLTQLTTEEVTDLFQAVHAISRMVERVYGAMALNIAVQDGPLAGQSVPHVHCHIIPRTLGDLPDVDDIYKMLETNNISEAQRLYRERMSHAFTDKRLDRSEEEMAAEATKLAAEMQNSD